MESSLEILAFLGLLVFLVGRFALWSHAAHMGTMWIIAIRYLPFGDIAFLVRHWDLAKTGAITSLTGMALMMPYVGQQIHEEMMQDRSRPVSYGQSDEYGELLAMAQSEEGIDHARRIQLKAEKVDAINRYLASWYPALQQRRQTVGSMGAAAVQQFNLDAAAYQELVALSKAEAEELNALRSQPAPTKKDAGKS